jgi:hypothetical protein
MRVTAETSMDNGYEQEPIGPDRVRFTVHPVVLRRSRGVPLLLGGLAGVLVVVGSGGPAAAPPGMRLAGGVVSAMVVGWVAGVLARTREKWRDRVRAPGGSFVASPSGIETAGRRIAREALNGLAIRNPLAGRAAPSLIRGSYALCVGSMVLAGGMSESVARGLLDEVRRVLDSRRRR